MKKRNRVFRNQRGMTLLEIGAVIVIMTVITFLAVRAVDGLMDQSRISGVRGDFSDFQTATESYLRSTAGVNVTATGLNKYLDKKLEVTTNTSAEKDPWDVAYNVQFKQKTATAGDYSRIVVSSSGRTGTTGEFIMASYYKNGVVETCTSGFSDNNLALKTMTFASGQSCGGNIN